MYNYRNQHESRLLTKAKEGIKTLILSSIEIIKVIVLALIQSAIEIIKVIVLALIQSAILSILIQYLWNHCLVSSFSVLPILSFINVLAVMLILKLIKVYT